MTEFVDFFDKPIEADMKVLYTTNAEGSTLNLGRVIETYVSVPKYGGRGTKKVKIRRLHTNGQEEMEIRYVGGFARGDNRNWEETGKPVRASIIDYSKNKILVLE